MSRAAERQSLPEPEPAVDGRRQVLAWAFYDWGNSAFATTVMAGFFPVFFKQYFSAGSDAADSTLRLGLANSVASVLVAAAAPLLGAIADRSSAKKRFVGGFAALGAVMTAALYLVGRGQWQLAAACYVAAAVGFSGSIVFYDSLLVAVAPAAERDRVSALGYGLGYLGGGLLLAVNVAMTLWPARFGLSDAAEAVRVAFMTVALWWALFTLPLLLWVREPAASASASIGGTFRDAARQLSTTLRRVRELPQVWTFLLAYWLYIDGVDTIIRMAVDYGLALGFDSGSLITALLLTQFVGFPAAIAFGWLGQRVGSRRGILLGLAVYLGVTVYGYALETEAEFYGLAVVIGLVQGGVQALSRAFYSRLIPAEEAAEFFGFYNMLGKFAAILGPALMGWVSVATGSPRLSILAIALLFLAGGALLLRVPAPYQQ
ncbi:MAG: MFS transporter [Myxococcales bacterium]|nr:MFS transporter [Myxococcales bacterium]